MPGAELYTYRVAWERDLVKEEARKAGRVCYTFSGGISPSIYDSI